MGVKKVREEQRDKTNGKKPSKRKEKLKEYK